MDRSPPAGGSAGRRGRSGWRPAAGQGPIRGRSLGLLQDVKRTVGRVNGGWPHGQSQAGRFDSCLSQPPPCPPPRAGRVTDPLPPRELGRVYLPEKPSIRNRPLAATWSHAGLRLTGERDDQTIGVSAQEA